MNDLILPIIIILMIAWVLYGAILIDRLVDLIEDDSDEMLP